MRNEFEENHVKRIAVFFFICALLYHPFEVTFCFFFLFFFSFLFFSTLLLMAPLLFFEPSLYTNTNTYIHIYTYIHTYISFPLPPFHVVFTTQIRLYPPFFYFKFHSWNASKIAKS